MVDGALTSEVRSEMLVDAFKRSGKSHAGTIIVPSVNCPTRIWDIVQWGMSKRRLSKCGAPCNVQRASHGSPVKVQRNRRPSYPCLICQPAACPTRLFVRLTTFVHRYLGRQHAVYKRIVTRPQEGDGLATTRNACALRRLAIIMIASFP